MRTVIKLEHVSKKFSEEQVLKDVCFEFQEGKISVSYTHLRAHET